MFDKVVVLLALFGVALGTQFNNLIFSEDFSKGLDFSLWKHEIVGFLPSFSNHIIAFLFLYF